MVTYVTYVTNVRKDTLFNDTAMYILVSRKTICLKLRSEFLQNGRKINVCAMASIYLCPTVEIKSYERARIALKLFMEVSDVYNFS